MFGKETKFLKIGHRGAMGYEPENTLASFQKAIELGADAVELDVHVCKSGELVVIHDDTLDRTTNGKGHVKDKTLTELKALDAGKGSHISTLNEVLDFIAKKISVNIELKGEKTAFLVGQTITEYIEKGWSEDQFLVSSFNYDELMKVSMFYPALRTGLLFGRLSIIFFELADLFRCYSLNAPLQQATQRIINKAHERGLKFFVWTANEPKDIKRLKNMSVDGIFSNFPDRLTN